MGSSWLASVNKIHPVSFSWIGSKVLNEHRSACMRELCDAIGMSVRVVSKAYAEGRIGGPR